jgi:hypothetical protein
MMPDCLGDRAAASPPWDAPSTSRSVAPCRNFRAELGLGEVVLYKIVLYKIVLSRSA